MPLIVVKSLEKALEQLISLGFDRVLTSGQQPTAELGIPLLRRLEELSKGRIRIMAGCGVNEKNIAPYSSRSVCSCLPFLCS